GIEISFRESNLIMNTKRLRSHNPTSAFNFAILQIIAMNLLLSFFLYLQLRKSMPHTLNTLPLSRKARYVFERVSVFYYLVSPST
ncbi:MAG: hypothetical protein RMJ37_07375, partial [Spirochaetia bacterium]|nr:hypothetical protein [Spirochaetota bacterium]MDW8113133.1 hypothetical protein [Spirochaetia bacterium]